MTRLAYKLSLIVALTLGALAFSATPTHAQVFGWRQPVYVSSYYTAPTYYAPYGTTYYSGYYYPTTTYYSSYYTPRYTYSSGYYAPATSYSSYYYTPTYTVPATTSYYYTPYYVYPR